MSYAQPVGKGSINYAGAKTAHIEVKWCISFGYRDTDLECDSQVIFNMIKGNTGVAWSLHCTILEIKKLLAGTNSRISHCYREAN